MVLVKVCLLKLTPIKDMGDLDQLRKRKKKVLRRNAFCVVYQKCDGLQEGLALLISSKKSESSRWNDRCPQCPHHHVFFKARKTWVLANKSWHRNDQDHHRIDLSSLELAPILGKKNPSMQNAPRSDHHRIDLSFLEPAPILGKKNPSMQNAPRSDEDLTGWAARK